MIETLLDFDDALRGPQAATCLKNDQNINKLRDTAEYLSLSPITAINRIFDELESCNIEYGQARQFKE